MPTEKLGAMRLIWPLGMTAGLLLLWELVVRGLSVRSIILPPRSEIFAVMITRHQLLLGHLWPSLYMTVFGFVLSVIGGIAVAIVITYSRVLRLGLYPVIVASQ